MWRIRTLQDNIYVNQLNKRESFKRLINLMLSAICLALETGIFAYNWMMHFRFSIVEDLRTIWFRGHLLEIAIYGAILFFASATYGGMRLGYMKNAEIIFSQIFATLMANVLIYAEISVMSFQLYTPKMFIVMTLEQALAIFVYMNIANKIYKSVFPPRELFLIHGDRPIRDICNKFEIFKFRIPDL